MSVVSVMVGMVALLGDWFLRVSFRGRKSSRKSSQLDVIFLVLGMLFAILAPFIAQLIKTNIRELEGALVRVIACSFLEEKQITLDLVKEILKDRD